MSESVQSDRAPFNRMKNCRHGQMVYNYHDQFVGRSLDLYGQFSEEEVELFRQLLRPGDLVIEAGANIGAHTLAMARIVSPDGGVIAIEPQPLVFQTLCANMAINSITNVSAVCAAAGEAPGSILIPMLDPNTDQNFGGLSIDGYKEGSLTAIITIDSLNVRSCRLIKVDVEGMEIHVLRGAQQTIRAFHPVLYVENDRPDRSADLIRYIGSLGYDMYWHRPPLFSPENFCHNGENIFKGIVSENMLCIPPHASASIEGFPRVQFPPLTPPYRETAPMGAAGFEPTTSTL